MQQPRHLIERALIGLSYPAEREDLLSHVRAHGSQPQVLAVLASLPNQRFDSVGEVMAAIADR